MLTTTSLRKKAAAAALVALTIGAGVTAQTGAAEARGGHNGIAAVGAIAAIAGLAIAAGAGQAHAAPQYYGYDDGYAGYAQPQAVYYRNHGGYDNGYDDGARYQRRHYGHRYPGYSETGYAYRGPTCKIKRQQVFDGYGWTWQRVQVCR